MTQTDRIAAALKAHPNGVTQADWTGPHTIDNGPPILRLAARILELKTRGFPIEIVGTRDRCAVYQLDRDKYLAQAQAKVRSEYPPAELLDAVHQTSMNLDESDFAARPSPSEAVTADGLRMYDPRSEWA